MIKLYTLSARFLPKYLWDAWKPQLKSKGIQWQLFLRALSACDHDVISWVKGNKSWSELIDVIIKVLDKAQQGVYPLWPP